MPQTEEQRAIELAQRFPERAVRIGHPCPEDGHPVTAVTGPGSHSNCQIIAVPPDWQPPVGYGLCACEDAGAAGYSCQKCGYNYE